MALEIERKFLVTSRSWQKDADGGHRIRQAYLSNTAKNSIRVRIIDDRQARLTIKSSYRGIVRDEFEYEIPLADGLDLLHLRQSTIIDKVRYRVEHAGVVWEIDEFFGANAGLVLAEVELDREDHDLARPAWVGREVTSDKRFNNSQLAAHPFGEWARSEQAVR